MPQFECLQTADFVDELRLRIGKAEDRILIQLMTFDGDSAGQEIADLLCDAVERGVEVKLLIDCFVKRFVSDTSVKHPDVIQEAAATELMYARLRQSGVSLKFTHPQGPGALFALARNHKKIFVIDDLAFLGGINVSEHNFEWLDFMVKIDNHLIHSNIVEDFEHSFEGGRRSVRNHIVTNAELESVFDSMVLGAQESIVLASPYALDVGLVGLMSKASAPNISVVATRHNNLLIYRTITPFIESRLRGLGVNMLSYTNFSHSKFLLVDDKKLLVGSSNFGRHSFGCNQEICLVIDDQGFIADFKATLLKGTAPLVQASRWHQVAFGALVSYIMHACVYGVRHLVAPRVPPLARH